MHVKSGVITMCLELIDYIIIKLQEKAIRFIGNLNYRDHTNELFCKLKFLKFIDLVKFKTLCIMYRAKNGLLSDKLKDFFCLLNEK